jgi:C1A family cysteine protease
MSPRILGGTLLASALALLTPWPAPAQDTVGQPAPLAPRFTTWVAKGAPRGLPAGGPKEGGPRMRGYVPPPLDLSHIKGPVFSTGEGAPPYPPFYDLRTSSSVTPVKDQGDYGTCWTFACMGSLESSQLKAGRGAFDLSEWHLAYYGYVPFNTSLLTAFTPGAAEFGQDPIFDQGGDDWMSTAILARGTGAVDNKDCPYMPGAYVPKPIPQGNLPNGREKVSVPVENVLYLFNAELPINANDVKYALIHYGPAVISMDWEDDDYDPAMSTYRDTTATEFTLNHEVCIIGWDDSFETCRFPASNRPANPGAWIVRNSWSRDWGNAGYFYLSYDSKVFDGTVFLGSPRTTHHLHQYDPLGWCDSIGCGSSTACCANIFHADEDEQVAAVAFYAGAVGTSYEVDLHTAVTGDPSTGISDAGRRGVPPQMGTLQVPGYHTVTLEQPVAVAKGTSFAVLLKLTTPGYAYPIPVECALEGYSQSATFEHGRSFLSPDGATWHDLAPDCTGSAACLKALAD